MPGQAAAQQVLEARVGGRGHRDRVAVAAEPAGEPEDVTGSRSGAGSLHALGRASGRRRAGRARPSALCGALDQRLQVRRRACRAGAGRRCAPVTRPGARQPRQRVRDRRALGRHQLAEQPVGERQAEADARTARPAPSAPPGATAAAPSRTSSRGWQVIARSTSRSVGPALGAAQQRVGDLRPRPHPLGELVVEHREPRRPQRPPRHRRARAARRRGRHAGCSRSPAPSSSVRCGRRSRV